MPIVGVSIEKETTFHAQPERYSNQYYYSTVDIPVDPTELRLSLIHI